MGIDCIVLHIPTSRHKHCIGVGEDNMTQVTVEDLVCGDVVRGRDRDHTVVAVETGRSVVYLCTRIGGTTTCVSKVGKGTQIRVIKSK